MIASTATIDAEGETPSKGSEPRISHAALLTAAQLCRALLRLSFVVVVARALGPNLFGTYALLLATVEMVAVASGTGYTDYLTREASTDEHLGWGLASQLISLRALCLVPLVSVALGVLVILRYPPFVIVAAAWFSISLLFRAVSEAVQGVLRGTEHYLAFLLIEVLIGLGLTTGAGYVLVRGGNLSAVVATEITASAAGACGAICAALKFRSHSRSHLHLRSLLKASLIFNLYAFVGNLYDRIDVILLSTLAGDYATGIYSAGYRPLGAVQLLPYGVLYSLLPSLTRTKCSGSDRARLEKTMGFLFSTALLIILVTMAFADRAIPALLGSRFSETAVALKILVWAVVFRYLNYALNIVFLSLRQERIFVLTSIVCLVINLCGNLLFIPVLGWRAAALLTIATEIALFAQNIFWLQRLSGTVPKPAGWLRTVLVFLVALGIFLLGKGLGYSMVVGGFCVIGFLLYFLLTGQIWQSKSVHHSVAEY